MWISNAFTCLFLLIISIEENVAIKSKQVVEITLHQNKDDGDPL